MLNNSYILGFLDGQISAIDHFMDSIKNKESNLTENIKKEFDKLRKMREVIQPENS